MANAIINEAAGLNNIPANTTTSTVVTKTTKTASIKRSRKVNPLWITINRANRMFNMQLVKNNETKLSCLEVIAKANFSDVEKFWAAYMAQANRLLDSHKFTSYCKNNGMDAVTIASHIVYQGKATLERVLSDGVEHTIGRDILLYKDNFIPDIAMGFALKAD